MTKQRLAVVVLSTIGMLTTFMPWVSMPLIGTVAGSKGDGWFSFTFFLITLVIGLIGQSKNLLSKSQIFGISIFGLLASLLGIWKIIDFNSAMAMTENDDNMFSQAFSLGFSIEFGLYLLVLTGLLISILPFFLEPRGQEKSTGIETS